MNAERAELIAAMAELVSTWEHMEKHGAYESEVVVISALARAAKAWKARTANIVKIVPSFERKASPQDSVRMVLTSLESMLEAVDEPTQEDIAASLALVRMAKEEVSR